MIIQILKQILQIEENHGLLFQSIIDKYEFIKIYQLILKIRKDTNLQFKEDQDRIYYERLLAYYNRIMYLKKINYMRVITKIIEK